MVKSLNFYRSRQSCEGYVFTPVCHSVHGGGLPQCMLGYTHTQEQTPSPQNKGPSLGSRHPPPQQCMLGDTNNEWAVRILLECILSLHKTSVY